MCLGQRCLGIGNGEGLEVVRSDGKTYLHGDHVLVGPSVLGETVDGTAEAVFVGYGLEDKRFGLDDYRGLDVRGKVIVMLGGTPSGLPSDVCR